VVIGIYRIKDKPYSIKPLTFLSSMDALLPICASIAAWLYVFLSAPPRTSTNMLSRSMSTNLRRDCLIVGSILLALPIVFADQLRDPTCHNSLRDRNSASPSFMIEMNILAHDIDELDRLYNQFRIDYQLNSRKMYDDERRIPRSLCNEEVKIDIYHEGLGFYPHKDGSGWEPMANDLMCRLEANWGYSIRYSGNRGKITSRADVFDEPC